VDVDEGHWWFLSDRAPTEPVRQVSLLVLWVAEFEDAVAGVEPAGGDGFGSGEEVHAFGAVGVGVAEQGGSVRDDPLIGNLGEISMRCHSVPSGSRRACRPVSGINRSMDARSRAHNESFRESAFG
jgi:hypothetical protein